MHILIDVPHKGPVTFTKDNVETSVLHQILADPQLSTPIDFARWWDIHACFCMCIYIYTYVCVRAHIFSRVIKVQL